MASRSATSPTPCEAMRIVSQLWPCACDDFGFVWPMSICVVRDSWFVSGRTGFRPLASGFRTPCFPISHSAIRTPPSFSSFALRSSYFYSAPFHAILFVALCLRRLWVRLALDVSPRSAVFFRNSGFIISNSRAPRAPRVPWSPYSHNLPRDRRMDFRNSARSRSLIP